MEVTGKIVEIFEEQQVTNTFKKREFVVEHAENPQYPELLLFQAIQDKTSMIDSFSVGTTVTVSFNLKGRKWVSPQGDTKYFTTLQAWRISAATSSGSTPDGDPGFQDIPPVQASDAPADHDDLPF